MTDREIVKLVRQITGRGNTAEIKQNKYGIAIVEVKKELVRKDQKCD